MQYLYVLTSTPKDNYYSQFLLSLTSLRLVMPNANVTLLCDKQTKETLKGKRSFYESMVNNIHAVDVPDNMRQIEISRWLKTSLRHHIKGDFLFIDCDTIITGDLSSICELDIIFGACLDKHSNIDLHLKKELIISNEKKLKFGSFSTNKHFNSGVIYCKDTPQANKILNRWNELWLYSKSKGILRDQTSFNMAIYENLKYFSELDGIWNCQISYNGLTFLENAKIIHYFATDLFKYSSPYVLSSKIILDKISETGVIPDKAIEFLKNPKSAFVNETRIISGVVLKTLNSSYFEAILTLHRKMPFLFKLVNSFWSLIRDIIKLLYVRKSNKRDDGISHYN